MKPADFEVDLGDFEKIKELRSYAHGVLSVSSRNENTEKTYLRIANKLLKTEDSREALGPSGMRKRSWFHSRAACRFFLSQKILSDLSKVDHYKRNGDTEGAKTALRWALWSQDFLLNKLSSPASFDPYTERKENKSKRKTLGSLPDSWPIQVFDASPDSLKCAVAIHYLSGVRPEELEKGIRISKTPDGIEFVVAGAKVYRKGNVQVGQQERRIKIIFSTELERQMASVLDNGVASYKKDTVRKSLLRLSKKLFPRHTKPVSGYSFRHLFSSRLKKSGAGEEEIAMALGHASCRTQSQYGTARQTPGGLSISATATTPPRLPGRRNGAVGSARVPGPEV